MAKIRAAIVGVGNCASSLVQGVAYYRAAKQFTEAERMTQAFIEPQIRVAAQ